MASTLLIAYVALAVAASIGVFVLSSRLGDERRPLPERIGLSIAAGAVWPVILLGMAELSSFVMLAKAHVHDDDKARVEVLV